MAYQYDGGLEYDPQADSDHYWVDVGYIQNISPNRPPILNRENFSSSEAGTPVNDPNAAAEGRALSMNMNNVRLLNNALSSYPSSNDGSVRAPDGPERKDPANNFLLVAPATGLGEMQHHRRSLFNESLEHPLYCLSFLRAVKTYNVALGYSFWAVAKEHDRYSLFSNLRATMPEERNLSGINLFSLMTTTISEPGNELQSLPSLCPVSYFTSNHRSASNDYYLLENQDQDNREIYNTDHEEIYPTRRRKGSSKTIGSRPAECLISVTAFGQLASNFLQMISSYLVSNKYGVLKTRLHDQ